MAWQWSLHVRQLQTYPPHPPQQVLLETTKAEMANMKERSVEQTEWLRSRLELKAKDLQKVCMSRAGGVSVAAQGVQSMSVSTSL